jgi:hypothetical protein
VRYKEAVDIGVVEEVKSAGIWYLRAKVANDSCYMRSLSSCGSQCPTDHKGHLFCYFFVTEAIATELSAQERSSILSRIDQEKRNGIWGYSVDAPPDADDTTFVLRTLNNLCQTVDLTRLLETFLRDDGAFVTFLSGMHREKKRLAFDSSADNNCLVHPDVLANVYILLADTGQGTLIDEKLIQASQAPEGYFRSFFYPSRYYSTWMYLNLLEETGQLSDERNRAVRFILDSQNRDGSWGQPGNVYETALALNSIGREEIRLPRLQASTRFLLERQDIDGSWFTSQPIWVFRRNDDPLIDFVAYDSNRIVTTALSVRALKRHFGQKHLHVRIGQSQVDKPEHSLQTGDIDLEEILAREDETLSESRKNVLLRLLARREAERLGLDVELADVQAMTGLFRERFEMVKGVDLVHGLAALDIDIRNLFKLIYEITLVEKLEQHYKQEIDVEVALQRRAKNFHTWKRLKHSV